MPIKQSNKKMIKKKNKRKLLKEKRVNAHKNTHKHKTKYKMSIILCHRMQQRDSFSWTSFSANINSRSFPAFIL